MTASGISQAASALPSESTRKILEQVRQLLVDEKYTQAENILLLLADKHEKYFNKVIATLERYEYGKRTIKEKNCIECETYNLNNLFGNFMIPLHFEVSILNRIKVIEEIAEKAYKKLQKHAVKRYDNIAKIKGYKGYSGMPIFAFMYRVQKKGGLESHINSIFGCVGSADLACKYNSKIRIIQILDDMLLWSFSEHSGRELLTFTIVTYKEPNKMYVESQSMDDGFYALERMTTYQTVAGSTKTVPVFKKVYLDQ